MNTIRSELAAVNDEIARIQAEMESISSRYSRELFSYHPFSTLSDEIVGRILVLATHCHTSPTLRYQFPVLVRQVCRRWYDIVYNTPGMWTYLDNTADRGFDERVRLSADLMLDISLTIPSDPEYLGYLLEDILPVSSRWRSLAVHSDGLPLSSVLVSLPRPLPSRLSSITLTREAVGAHNDRWHSMASPVPEPGWRGIWDPDTYEGSSVQELVIGQVQGKVHETNDISGFLRSLDGLSSLRRLDLSAVAMPERPYQINTITEPWANLPLLDSIALRGMIAPLALWILSMIDARRLSTVILEKLSMPALASKYIWPDHQWYFPTVENLHLLEIPCLERILPTITTNMPAIKNVNFVFDLEAWHKHQCDLYVMFDPNFRSLWCNLRSLTTRYVRPSALLPFVKDVCPGLRSLRVHLEDLTLEFGDDVRKYRRLEREVSRLWGTFKFDVDSTGVVGIKKRFWTWEEREAWRRKGSYPELVWT